MTDYSISAGYDCTFGFQADGTAIAVGNNSYGQCTLVYYPNVTQISAGAFHTIALINNGSVISTGRDDRQQCFVSYWTSITQISAGYFHSVGLQSNGVVIARGDNTYGQCYVINFRDIVEISAGYFHTVVLHSDGWVEAKGNNSAHQCETYRSSGWENITHITAGAVHTVGLKSDGTVIAIGDNTYGQCNVSSWTNITQVSANFYHTVGLKSDGTVVAVGLNTSNQCDVSSWTNIMQVSAGGFHTVGLKSDGTVVAVGLNTSGQCQISDWDLSAPITYSISGTTSIQGILTTGITVRAYNRSTGLLEGSAVSDEFGNFTISNLPSKDIRYLICLDKNSPIIYNSLIKDRVLLGGTPEEGDYIQITVSHSLISSNLTNFPLLINLSTASGLSSTDISNIFAVLGENKYKIKLKDSSNVEHYVEIETWDSANNKAILHTKVDLSSSVDSVFKLYYSLEFADNTSYIGITGSTVAQNVWDSNYVAVYTMAQDPSIGGACMLDSTVNALHGTPYGAMTSAQLVDGAIDKGISFNGSSTNYISLSNNSLLNPNSATYEISLKFNASTSNRSILAKDNLNARSYNVNLYNGVRELQINGGATIRGSSSYILNTINTYLFCVTGSSSSGWNYYINGILDGSAAWVAPATTSADVMIGRRQYGAYADPFSGVIYSVKISDTVRPLSWISASNKSLKDELITFTN